MGDNPRRSDTAREILAAVATTLGRRPEDRRIRDRFR